jgi:hypothetical protein
MNTVILVWRYICNVSIRDVSATNWKLVSLDNSQESRGYRCESISPSSLKLRGICEGAREAFYFLPSFLPSFLHSPIHSISSSPFHMPTKETPIQSSLRGPTFAVNHRCNTITVNLFPTINLLASLSRHLLQTIQFLKSNSTIIHTDSRTIGLVQVCWD